MKKEVKVTKDHMLKINQSQVIALSILIIKGVIQVEILHKVLKKVLVKQLNDSIFTF